MYRTTSSDVTGAAWIGIGAYRGSRRGTGNSENNEFTDFLPIRHGSDFLFSLRRLLHEVGFKSLP